MCFPPFLFPVKQSPAQNLSTIFHHRIFGCNASLHPILPLHGMGPHLQGGLMQEGQDTPTYDWTPEVHKHRCVKIPALPRIFPPEAFP